MDPHGSSALSTQRTRDDVTASASTPSSEKPTLVFACLTCPGDDASFLSRWMGDASAEDKQTAIRTYRALVHCRTHGNPPECDQLTDADRRIRAVTAMEKYPHILHELAVFPWRGSYRMTMATETGADVEECMGTNEPVIDYFWDLYRSVPSDINRLGQQDSRRPVAEFYHQWWDLWYGLATQLHMTASALGFPLSLVASALGVNPTMPRTVTCGDEAKGESDEQERHEGMSDETALSRGGAMSLSCIQEEDD